MTGFFSFRICNPVLLTLFAVGAFAAASFGFLNHADNRLANGVALSLWRAPVADRAAIFASLGALFALSFLPVEKGRAAALLAGAALVFACLGGAGHFADLVADRARPAERISLGAAFWLLVAVALLTMLDAAQRGVSRFLLVAAVAALPLGFLVVARQESFAHLALAREFAVHRAEFMTELARHLSLVGAGVFLALIIGVPLTMLALRRADARGPLFTVLGIVQTIPSIALFGALIAPLAALSARFPLLREWGVGGTGATPAIIALTLYSAPPLVRIFATGFDEVAREVKDAAAGLGFDRRQTFVFVELPLALPALISGLRVVVVQAIGLAAVAALIGAGGLGVFVFQGIGQYALDLVLVGAIPIILLALAADLLFQAALAAAWRRA